MKRITWKGKIIRTMERYFRAFCRKPVKIVQLNKEDKDLAYTTNEGKKPVIYINLDHEVASGLSVPKKEFFYLGVFCHEMLHQIYSDFDVFSLSPEYRGYEKNLLMQLLNLVEDPAIEYMAPESVGGRLLEALRFSIAHIFDMSEPLEKSETALNQFIMALIQFGDMGTTKGHFTEELAAECFRKSVPPFNRGVKSPIPQGRFESAKEILEISRPLWADRKDSFDEIKKILERQGKSPEGIFCGEARIGKGISSHSEVDDRRDELEKCLKDAESECDSGEVSDDSSLDSLNSTLDEKSCPETAEMSKESREWMKKEGEKSEREIQKERKDEETTLPDESVQETMYDKGSYSLGNYNVAVETDFSYFESEYAKMLEPYQGAVHAFSKKLKRLFSNDIVRKCHTKEGKINIKRFYSPKVTSRIFEKKKNPKEIDDLIVEILIDQSGSMDNHDVGCSRIDMAKKMAVCLSETFALLNIPLYVVGFSGEEEYDVELYHYIKWKNTKKERLSLLNLTARCQNFDSYCISYAADNLMKKRSKHKLLIVLSDGIPYCSLISKEQGMTDTRAAITKARKQGIDVVGIAIGNSSTEQIQYLYGKNFLHCSDVTTSFVKIAKEIHNIIKYW